MMPRRSSRGFTLIELITLVAAGGLLVAVFVPTMTAAREQARVAKCLANLRAITQAAGSYIEEHGTIVFAFPWDYEIDGQRVGFDLATEFIWGGGVPDRRAAQWPPELGLNPAEFNTDTYCITPAQRPLNAYMSPGVWWSDPLRVKGNAARYKRPMLLPDVFQCPSDALALVPGGGEPNVPDPNSPNERWYPTWQWWGTSYAINWYWAYFYSHEGPILGRVGDPGILDGPWHRQILESKQQRGASEWALFFENRLNYAFAGARPRGYPGAEPSALTGWHRERGVHAAGFLDGSARYGRFETPLVDGPGWTLWPNRPWDGTPWEPYQGY